MRRSKLAAEPEPDGCGGWIVRSTGGIVDVYNCKVDACRANAQVTVEARLLHELQGVKRLWASELAAAATARGSRFGNVEVDLTSLPEAMTTSLLRQALDE